MILRQYYYRCVVLYEWFCFRENTILFYWYINVRNCLLECLKKKEYTLFDALEVKKNSKVRSPVKRDIKRPAIVDKSILSFAHQTNGT